MKHLAQPPLSPAELTLRFPLHALLFQPALPLPQPLWTLFGWSERSSPPAGVPGSRSVLPCRPRYGRGCKVCTIACPFGTINYVQETGKVQKCDLCGGEPACAEACPTGAITFIDANWTGLGKMAQWADKLGNQPSAV